MTPITDIESAVTAKCQIEQALLKRDGWQLEVADGIQSSFEARNYELRIAWGKLIFSWWDDSHAQSWRLTSYQLSPELIWLHGIRGLAQASTRLILKVPDAGANREPYEEVLRRSLLSLGYRIRGMKKTGPFFKVVLETGRSLELLIAIDESHASAQVETALAAGIRWLSAFNEARPPTRQARKLLTCLPAAKSLTIRQRLGCLSTGHLGATISCLELDLNTGLMISIPRETQEELLQAPGGKFSWPALRASQGLWQERICSLAPDLIEVRPVTRGPGQRYLIHGLEFACETGSIASFGVNDGTRSARTRLTGKNFGALSRMVRDLRRFRRSGSTDRHHPFYALRPESWLESLLRRDISALDSGLDGRYVYAQIPTWRGRERSIIDLLTVDRSGRLVVIEIKAAPEPELPFQGLDYWLRIEQARRRAELQRRRLFTGIELADAAPLLYLVAPVLSFHRSFRTIAECISEEVEAYRIGVNGGWRARMRVELKERVNPAK